MKLWVARLWIPIVVVCLYLLGIQFLAFAFAYGFFISTIITLFIRKWSLAPGGSLLKYFISVHYIGKITVFLGASFGISLIVKACFGITPGVTGYIIGILIFVLLLRSSITYVGQSSTEERRTAFILAFSCIGNITFSLIHGLATASPFLNFKIADNELAISFFTISSIIALASLILTLTIIGNILGGVKSGIFLGVLAGFAFSISIQIGMTVASNVDKGIKVLFDSTFLLLFAGRTLLSSLVFCLIGGVISCITATHFVVYPVQFFISLVSLFICRLMPNWTPALWSISPVRWDEVILLPLPGLSELLVTLSRLNRTRGFEAIDELSRHRYRMKTAWRARARVALEDARRIDTLLALRYCEKELAWVSSDIRLPSKVKYLLQDIRVISQEIDAAFASVSLPNRCNRLTTAHKRIHETWLRYASYREMLERWGRLVEEGLKQAQLEMNDSMNIPQVYYKEGLPISADDPSEETPFKGRREVIRQLEESLGGNRRVPLLLLGTKRSGKTSLLKQLPRKLGPHIIPAFLDFQSPKLASNNDAGLLIGMSEEIVETAYQFANKYHRGRINFPKIDRDAFNKDPYPVFGQWLEKTEKLLGDQVLLICFDEFEGLGIAIENGRVDKRILSTIRNLIQHHSNIAVLLSGSHHVDELHDFWGEALINTQFLHIGFLDDNDARELVVQPVSNFPQIYSPDAVNLILQLTRGQPYLIQLLCGLLVDKINSRHDEPPVLPIHAEDVKSVIPKVIRDGQYYFSSLWKEHPQVAIGQSLLEQLAHAHGDFLTSDQVQHISPNKDALRSVLRSLLRREIVERTNNGYRILVPLMAYYVQDERPQI
ncbi:MAG: hypothetical protein IPM66_14640 [Acidobacteriota bacterium]|nr:MAG: hypothetical protein IPM66_14640 [Acidobacteriota bacterium]